MELEKAKNLVQAQRAAREPGETGYEGLSPGVRFENLWDRVAAISSDREVKSGEKWSRIIKVEMPIEDGSNLSIFIRTLRDNPTDSWGHELTRIERRIEASWAIDGLGISRPERISSALIDGYKKNSRQDLIDIELARMEETLAAAEFMQSHQDSSQVI
jgi:hypothetical protein